MEELNTRYGADSPAFDRFHLFHHKRLWNASEGKWIGCERKRGKLEEFNRLLRGARLKIDPCVPRWWRDFEIQYRHGATLYHIKVENPHGVCRGIAALEFDGAAQATDDIPLKDDGEKHSVRVVLGERKQSPDAEQAPESGRASLP